MSPYNKLDGGRYYDARSQVSFEFDHVTQVRTYQLFGAQSCLELPSKLTCIPFLFSKHLAKNPTL